MTRAPKRCNGYPPDPEEAEALLKILERGDQEVHGGKVEPLAHVVNRLRPDAIHERGLEELKTALLVGAGSERGRHVDEHLSELRARVKDLEEKKGRLPSTACVLPETDGDVADHD